MRGRIAEERHPIPRTQPHPPRCARHLPLSKGKACRAAGRGAPAGLYGCGAPGRGTRPLPVGMGFRVFSDCVRSRSAAPGGICIVGAGSKPARAGFPAGTDCRGQGRTCVCARFRMRRGTCPLTAQKSPVRVRTGDFLAYGSRTVRKKSDSTPAQSSRRTPP